MISDELNEVRVELSTMSTLLWFFNNENELDNEFFWGLGMILHRMAKRMEKAEGVSASDAASALDTVKAFFEANAGCITGAAYRSLSELRVVVNAAEGNT